MLALSKGCEFKSRPPQFWADFGLLTIVFGPKNTMMQPIPCTLDPDLPFSVSPEYSVDSSLHELSTLAALSLTDQSLSANIGPGDPAARLYASTQVFVLSLFFQ